MKMSERELKRERDLFNRLGEHLFSFQERDDRWKERLRRGRGKKKKREESAAEKDDIKKKRRLDEWK